MTETPARPDSAPDPQSEIAALLRVLHDAEERLRHLTGGTMDAVVHPDGTYLLQRAREQLRQSEAAQRELAETQMSILNALPVHVALLDPDGVILSLNDAWRRFATPNGLLGQNFAVGQNYLEVCERVASACSEEAESAAPGIRRVLSGEARDFILEYPCHLPTEPRWFRLMATPLNEHRRAGAVIMHLNMTSRKLAEEALREGEERFRGTFEQAAVGMAHVSTEGRFVRVNDKLCEILGYSRDEILARTFSDLTLPEDHDASEEARQAMLAGTTPFYVTEKRYARKDGRVIWGGLVSTLQRTPSGHPRYFITVVEDITDRKLSEFRLHRLNRLHTVLSKVGEAIVRTTDRQTLYKNVCRILVEDGLLREALIFDVSPDGGSARAVAAAGVMNEKRRHMEIFADSGLARHGTVAEVLRTRAASVLNDLLADPDMRRWLEGETATKGISSGASFPLTVAGTMVGVLLITSTEVGYFQEDEIGVMAAVSDNLSFALEAQEREVKRREAEETQRRSAEELRHLAEALEAERSRLVAAQAVARIGSWETDLTSFDVVWSDETYRIFETTRDRFRPTHQGFLQLVHPDDRPAVDAAFATSMNSGVASTIEHRILMLDGRISFVEERWQVIKDDRGTPVRAIGTCQDITVRKALEQRFLRAQRMESVGTLAGGIAHDLNNVLAPILLSIDLLKDTAPDDDSRELLKTMRGSAERGAHLVRQVLSFARGVAGERIAVNPLALIRDLLHVMQETFPKSVDVRMSPSHDLWTVSGDPTQLHQVFLNLCVNARDAMPDGGLLTIRMENAVIDETYAAMHPDSRVGAFVVLEVEDTGTGIRPDIRGKIFEPFFTTKEVGKGTGLGLSTTLTIVQSHGGFISVSSEIGQGTTFKVYLPATSPGRTAHMATEETTALPRGHGELVLVVDDEAPVREIARRTLERFGYRVMLACNGAEAISLYAQHQPEVAVVITDMAMPVMGGAATITALRTMNPAVRLIGSSGLSGHGSIAEATGGTGVRYFMAKPYTAEVLLRTLRQALRDDDGPPQ